MRTVVFMVLVCGVLSTMSTAQASSAEPARSNAAFAKLRSLAGDWEGTYNWLGGQDQHGKVIAEYYLTGNGSAVEENLTQDGVPSMTSVYHLDGTDLRMTHFCAAQNQPRLRATAYSPDGNQITFSFVDITNLSSPTAGHVDGLDLRFLAPDHINLRFHFIANGKSREELLDLSRKK